MDTLFNVNQAAYILKVHPLTIRRYIREKKLKAIKAGGAVRIKETDLVSFTRDFAPKPQPVKEELRIKAAQSHPFTNEDPMLQLEGRGASVQLVRPV